MGGRCIAVATGDASLYTGVCHWGSPAQRWKFRADKLIESVQHPGQCIDVKGNPGVRKGQRLQLHSCEFGWKITDQAWHLRPDGFIESVITPGQCVDVLGDPAGWANAKLQLWSCEEDTSRTDQRWMISQQEGEPEPDAVLASQSRSSQNDARSRKSPAASSVAAEKKTQGLPSQSITSGQAGVAPLACFLENAYARGRCANVQPKGAWVPAALKFEGQELHLLPCAWGEVATESRWKFRPDGFIESVQEPGQCVDVRGNPGGENGDVLQLRECEFGWKVTDQRWTFRTDGFIENALHSGKCLDVDGWQGNVAPNARLQLWDCEATDPKSDQRWLCSQEPNQQLPNALVKAEQAAKDADAAAIAQKYAVAVDAPVHSLPLQSLRPSTLFVVLLAALPLGAFALAMQRLPYFRHPTSASPTLLACEAL